MTGFILDMDGTLLDSVHAWFEAEQYVLDTAGITLLKEERDELNMLSLEEAGVWFHERFGVFSSGEEVSQIIFDFMIKFYRYEAQAKPGAAEFVRTCYEAGAPLCMLSSSPPEFIRAGLEHTNLLQYFPDNLLISAEMCGLFKRESATFNYVCDQFGTAPHETWLFDDSWYALATARETGLHCVGVYSSEECGSREELARYSEIVVDDFATLNAWEFI